MSRGAAMREMSCLQGISAGLSLRRI